MTDTSKSFQPGKKDIKYLGKDFDGLKSSLLEFAKTYYPNTYKDFGEASTGMMFIDMAAYVGDVLSYYTDYQFKESLAITAEERKNIISLARYMGYKPKVSTASVGTLDVYQLVPAIKNDDGTFSPDYRYAQVIKQNMEVAADSNVNFITDEPVDFTLNTINDPTEVSVFQRNSSGQPEFYVLKKNVSISSGTITVKSISVSDASQYYSITLDEDNIIGIVDVYDSDGNRWYESDYLSQDLVPIQTENIVKNDSTLSQYRDSVPFLLKFLKTSRRFVTSVDEFNKTTLEFGSGVNVQGDSIVLPSPATVKKAAAWNNIAYDPANFLNNSSYGQAPNNTTLTIKYIIGGGTISNANANSIKNIVTVEFFGDLTGMADNDKRVTELVRSTIKVNNPEPAIGGKGAETDNEIKQNSMANFSAQNRAVTKQDYVIRTYAMPAKYGSVAKAYITSDSSLSNTETNNPYAINLYILCKDANGRLVSSTPALVQNLKNYLDEFRLLTDSINIIDGFIINIGLEFSIIVYKNYNKNEVLANCINSAKSYLSIDNMQFSQPINISRLRLELAKIDGVQSVTSINLKNLTIQDGDYSSNAYNITSATSNDMIYPSIDPSVFEVRFPTKDIVGKAI